MKGESLEVLVLEKPISWLDGIDVRTGEIVQRDHPQKGISIAGKTIRIPHSIGSTVGAYTFFKLVRNKVPPKKIILERPDSITMTAVLAGIPVEMENERPVEELKVEGVPESFLRYLEKEASFSSAKGFVRVSSVHLSGISYATIGEEGLDFLKKTSKTAKFRVLATTNPAGMDLKRWRKMGIPEDFAEKQLRIVRLLLRMGAVPTFTCTPYLAGNLPTFGEHVCWGESSAVSFVNSVIGARTNREGSIKGIVAATVGYTPLYGKHLDEERTPNLRVEMAGLEGFTEFSLAGYIIGKVYPSAVPFVEGVHPSYEELKAFGAAAAASGGIELFHVRGFTPEAHLFNRCDCERLKVEKSDITTAKEELSSYDGNPDLIAIGCPHLSMKEIIYLAELSKGRKTKIMFWVFTSRSALSQCQSTVKMLEKSGIEVYADTCMVVSPLERMGFRRVVTNSAKAAKYLRDLRKLDVMILSLEEITERFFDT